MNIVQIMPEFGFAGAEIMCEALTYELCLRGHRVTVISMYTYHSAITDRMESKGIDVRYLDKKPGWDGAMIRRIREVLRDVQADVVHTHRYCAQYAIPAAIRAKVPHRVHTLHSIAKKENGKLARRLNRIFFKRAGLIPVALSDLVRETVEEEYRLPKERIPVILNGIDLSKCEPKASYEKGDCFRILHVGRFAEVKNHMGLLAAFATFHQKHADSELWLIGDGETREAAENCAAELGIKAHVRFLGLRDDVHRQMSEADLFTLPSLYEGIPMTLIEAMGTGLPIVASEVGGIPDMLTDGENALLVEPKPEEICAAFERYYEDEKLRELHGTRAKARSVAFSAATMAEKYEELYNSKL